MATKKRFFRRSNLGVGNSAEKLREKTSVKKVIQIVKEKKQRVTLVHFQEAHPKKHYKSKEFPNISQFISEVRLQIKHSSRVLSGNISKLSVKRWLLVGIFSLLLVALIWQAVGIGGSLQRLFAVLTKRAKLQTEMTLWENIAVKYPTYRDANFKVAVIAYQLGDRQKEELYLHKTLEIDPNYIYAQNLGKLAN